MCRKHVDLWEAPSGVFLCVETPLPPRFRGAAGQNFLWDHLLVPGIFLISCALLPSWAMMPDSGSPVFTRSPDGPVRSARTSALIPTLPKIQPDIFLASADGNPSSATPIEGALGRAGKATMSSDHLDTPPGRAIVPAPLPVARGFVHMPTAPRCLFSCMLGGTTPYPRPAQDSLSFARGVR